MSGLKIKRTILSIAILIFAVLLTACDNAAETTPEEGIADVPGVTAPPEARPPARPPVDAGADWRPWPVLIDFENHRILRVSDRPLFNAAGGINQDVLDSLTEILGNPALDPLLRAPKSDWPGWLPFDSPVPYTVLTAADFSDFVVPHPTSMSHSGGIVIKLFETIPDSIGVHNRHLTEFTSQWWRLVYRTTADGSDVLTLWMEQPYRITPFNGTRYENMAWDIRDRFIDRLRDPDDAIWNRISPGIINTVFSDERIALGLPPCNNYFFEGNYSASIARFNLLRDMEAILAAFNVEAYLVAPRNLPGNWQSSAYQTGANMDMIYYATGEFYRTGDRGFLGSETPEGGLGATGLIWGTHRHFALINGKDGLSVGPYNGHWPNTRLVPTYDDLFWLPSDFEVRTMGFDKDNALFQTFITDPDDRASILRTNTEPETRPDNANGRSGLWRLNGWDRAFDVDGFGFPRGWMTEQVWLRSHDGLGIGNANTVSNTGNRYGYGVNQLAGMRPAVHLSITQLLQSAN
jgi:hypothetical protein